MPHVSILRRGKVRLSTVLYQGTTRGTHGVGRVPQEARFPMKCHPERSSLGPHASGVSVAKDLLLRVRIRRIRIIEGTQTNRTMSPLSQNRRRSEEGYMLVVVIFMLAILV